MRMIGLGTLVGLRDRQNILAAYWMRCNLQALRPLVDLIAQCRGSLRLPVKVRCIDFGGPGRLQVRPPVPTLDQRRGGWISRH